MKSGPERADRMVMISEVVTTDGYALVLADTVFIEQGEAYWTEDDALVVRRLSGQQNRYAGSWESRP
jgi:hypothetical protein